MTKSRNIQRTPKRFWTPAEEELLRLCYADALTVDLAEMLGMQIRHILAKANRMGLKKSLGLISETARERTMRPDHGSRRTRLKPGSIPWNKGKPGSCGTQEACRATQFKPGQKPPTTMPIGAYRVKEGTLEQKFSDAPGSPSMRWRTVHRLVWEAKHGSTPDGHVVVFRPGQQTTDPELVTLDRLELISRAENMRRNSCYTQMPPELARLVQLRGVLSRAINRKAKEVETHE